MQYRVLYVLKAVKNKQQERREKRKRLGTKEEEEEAQHAVETTGAKIILKINKYVKKENVKT